MSDIVAGPPASAGGPGSSGGGVRRLLIACYVVGGLVSAAVLALLVLLAVDGHPLPLLAAAVGAVLPFPLRGIAYLLGVPRPIPDRNRSTRIRIWVGNLFRARSSSLFRGRSSSFEFSFGKGFEPPKWFQLIQVLDTSLRHLLQRVQERFRR